MRVYLSYAQSDEAWATQLAHLLVSRGVEVVTPHRVPSIGEDWSRALAIAYAAMDAYIVLQSRESWSSAFLTAEIASLISAGRPLLSVVIGEKPSSTHPLLRQIVSIEAEQPEGALPKLIQALERIKRGDSSQPAPNIVDAPEALREAKVYTALLEEAYHRSRVMAAAQYRRTRRLAVTVIVIAVGVVGMSFVLLDLAERSAVNVLLSVAAPLTAALSAMIAYYFGRTASHFEDEQRAATIEGQRHAGEVDMTSGPR